MACRDVLGVVSAPDGNDYEDDLEQVSRRSRTSHSRRERSGPTDCRPTEAWSTITGRSSTTRDTSPRRASTRTGRASPVAPSAVVGEVPRLLGVGLGAGRPDPWLSPVTRPYWGTDPWSRGSYRRRRVPSVPRVYRRATPIPCSRHTKPMCSYIDSDPCPPRYPWLRRLVLVW